MRRTTRTLFACLALSALFVAGCGDDSTDTSTPAKDDAGTSASTTAPEKKLEGTITLSGGTSLTEALTQIGEDFSEIHPDVKVMFNFDSSTTLSTQILEGAPADLFAPADEANMKKLTDANLISGEPKIFTRNELVIVTKPGNPEGIETLADLAGAGVISLCGEKVPCGKYAAEALAKAGVTIDESSITRGQDVGATLTAVTDGDAVAGIVYVTDAAKAGDKVEAISIPEDVNVIATYPIGVLSGSANIEVAQALMDYVLGDEGQEVLADFGFIPVS